jgi:hypothetical protein
VLQISLLGIIVFGYLFHSIFWNPTVLFDLPILLMYFSISNLLKGFYVEQHKWDHTKGDRQYYIFGTLVS